MTVKVDFEQVLEETIEILRRRARRPTGEKTITYGDLCDAIRSRSFHFQDPELHDLLSVISTREDEAGRGLLSAIVVRSRGGLPGDGYFTLAELRGRDVSDRRAHHEAELEKVRAANGFVSG
jgi:hypothetical protein